MKRISILITMLAMSLILFGCKQTNFTNEKADTLPENIPSDFNFSVQYGYEQKNEINTFDGTFTKDLIEDGTVKTELNLSREEMEDIYNKMKEINIIEEKVFIPKRILGEVCVQEPHEDDKWIIEINGNTFSHYISGKYCEPTEDAKQFFDLRNYVVNIIKEKDEYKALPEPRGGYD